MCLILAQLSSRSGINLHRRSSTCSLFRVYQPRINNWMGRVKIIL